MIEYLFSIVLGVVSAVYALVDVEYVHKNRAEHRRRQKIEEQRVMMKVLGDVRGAPVARTAEKKYFVNDFLKDSKIQSPEEIWAEIE